MKVALADVLWNAANEHLAPYLVWPSYLEFSCLAVGAALSLDYMYDWPSVKAHPAVVYLEQLGCETGSKEAFQDFEAPSQRQGVRYMWLLLAMHVAEDEGLMVEVAP